MEKEIEAKIDESENDSLKKYSEDSITTIERVIRE